MLSDHFEKLVHFVGVARYGSIRGYANKNNLSQPAISKAVQILESDLGVSLLVRTQKGIQLTPAGLDLFQWAGDLLASSEDLSDKIKRKGNIRFRGKVRMGAYQSIGVYFLPSFFKFLKREQEDLRLSFETASSEALIEKVRNGEVDFVISVQPPKSRELFQLKLFDDQFSLYRSPTSVFSTDSAPIFTFLNAKDGRGISLEKYLRLARVSSRAIACSDFETAKAMALADAGWALLPDRVAAPLVESKGLVRETSFTKLDRIGPHSIVFSCQVRRAGEPTLTWLAEQLRLMLS